MKSEKCRIIGKLSDEQIAKIKEAQKPQPLRKPSYRATVRNGRFIIG